MFGDNALQKDGRTHTLKDEAMPNQARVAKVLAMLLASMTTGAIVLMALGHNPPSAGPFSLWTYQRLDPVKNAISSQVAQLSGRWNRIEIHYSGTRTGNIEQLASLSNRSDSEGLNCHFCLCNGLGGRDGEIQPTGKWQKQLPTTSGQNWYGGNQTVRICMIADGRVAYPTDCQIKRLQVLVEALCKRFQIEPSAIDYPSDWR